MPTSGFGPGVPLLYLVFLVPSVMFSLVTVASSDLEAVPA